MNKKWTVPQLRYICDSSLFYFIRIVNKPPKNHYPITTTIHKPHCDFAQDPTIKRKGYGMPRDWLKSTCLACWKIIWKYLRNSEERQLLAMENESLGMKKMNFISKQLLYNSILRKIYWDKLHMVDETWARRPKTRWSQTELDLPREGIYPEPAITVIGIKGAAQSGHYNTIYLDDIIGDAAVDSKLVMDDARLWVDNVNELTVEPDWNKPTASEINMLGSPWGAGDVYDYVKEKYPEYQWCITPCRKDTELKDTDTIKWIQDPNVYQGESNWGKQFSTEYYKEMAANPEKSTIYWSQHMCNPSKAAGLNKFLPEWLKFYDWDDRGDEGMYLICKDDKEEFCLAAIPLYGMIDPGGFAEIKVKKGSRNAVLIGGQARDTIKKFVTYTWAGKFKKPSLFIDEVFKAHWLQKDRLFRIDTVGTQPYIYKDILEARESKEIRDKYPNAKTLSISPLPHEPRKDSKDSEIQALMNPMANGEIYVHRSMFDLIAEIKQYPHGLTCDLLDMLAKLNKIYFTRKPMGNVEKLGWKSHREQAQSRNKVSGY